MQIHELNDYAGALDNSSYIAVDNGIDTGKLSTEGLLQQTNANIENVKSELEGRIDNIIAGGTAPSAAEVTDARHGASELGGVDYPSLGAAIRGQVGILENKLFNGYLQLTSDDFEAGVWADDGTKASGGRAIRANRGFRINVGDKVEAITNGLYFKWTFVDSDGNTTLYPTSGNWDRANYSKTYDKSGTLYLSCRNGWNYGNSSEIVPADMTADIKIFNTFKTELDDNIESLSEELYSPFTVNDFEYGTLYNGRKDSTTDSRFRTKHRFVLPYDLTIKPSASVRFEVTQYDGDSNTAYTPSGWISTEYTIPAWTIFNLLLADLNNTHKGAQYLNEIFESFEFVTSNFDILRTKANGYNTEHNKLVVTDEMKNWSYYIGAGTNNHSPAAEDIVTIAVPMSKGDYVEIGSGWQIKYYLADYENGSLDDKTTLISTANPYWLVGPERIAVSNDYTVFISYERSPAATTGDYSDFPDGIDIQICTRNYIKSLGGIPTIKDIQRNAFVSSYNTISWEDHAKAFSALFNGATDVDSFLFFTDCHIFHCSSAAERAACVWQDRFFRAMSYIQQMFFGTPCNMILNGGDWLGSYDTQAQALFMLSTINGAMREKFGEHYVMLLGNHDTNYQGYIDENSVSEDGILTQGAIDATYSSGKGKSFGTYQGATYKMYYFDTGIESSGLSSAYYKDQVKWFATELLSNTSEHIILALHIILNQGYYQDMFDEVTKCADAFNNRSSYSYDGETYDYSSVTVGTVSFAIGGHTHADSDGTHNNIPYVITTNASGYGNFTTLPIDLCMIDWTNSKLTLYRAEIGEAGTTREIAIL